MRDVAAVLSDELTLRFFGGAACGTTHARRRASISRNIRAMILGQQPFREHGAHSLLLSDARARWLAKCQSVLAAVITSTVLL